MIVNYLIIAIRNLRKQFSYSLINITGLSLGLATCLLLALWIRHELSFDQFHLKKDRIFRAGLEYGFGGQVAKVSVSPTALLPVLQRNFAEVETGVRLFNAASYTPYILRVDDKLFEESRFYFADSTFFDVFSFTLSAGNPNQALVNPNSIVITQAMADKYFGKRDPLGQTILVNSRTAYTVTGVLQNLPNNSMIRFDFIASFSSHPASQEQIWWSANYQTYLLFRTGSDVTVIQAKINDLVKKELANEITNAGDYVKYNLTPLTDLYLRSDVAEPEVVGSIQYVYVFSVIAFMVLAIACINYINLATAKATERAKEVGVRKVVGAQRQQLFFQFISESIVITLLAFLLATLMASGALVYLNELTGKQFSISDLLEPGFLFGALLVLLVLAVLSGAYPAVFITGFKPVQILKGNFKTSGKGIWLRKTLVTFQFATSVILIIGTWVIYNQLDFISNQRLGFDKENVIVLPLDRKINEVYSTLKTELLRNSPVSAVGRATEVPTRIVGGYTINLPGSSDRGMLVNAMSIDEDFVSTLGMQLTAGRNITEQDMIRTERDTVHAFLLNETAMQELGLDPAKAIGAPLSMNGRTGTLVGVIKDFHYSPLHEKIGPLVMFSDNAKNAQLNFFFVRIKPGDLNASIVAIKSVHQHLAPHRPFDYRFLNEQYQALYMAEQRMGSISTVFASFAIIIACLGLLGLVSYAVAQKNKEIGIRKVMGAGSKHIVILLTRDFTALITMGVMLGIPVSWYLLEKVWLTQFAYRVELGVIPFAGAAAICFLLAFIIAGYQSIKASWSDPVKILRNE